MVPWLNHVLLLFTLMIQNSDSEVFTLCRSSMFQGVGQVCFKGCPYSASAMFHVSCNFSPLLLDTIIFCPEKANMRYFSLMKASSGVFLLVLLHFQATVFEIQ